MNCPNCCARLNVLDSRAAANNTTKRRLVCDDCGGRYTSYEYICDDNPTTKKTPENKATEINVSDIFSNIAENAIIQKEFTSAITGGTYATREDAIADSINELKRLYKVNK